jgi:hypothetical protein
LLISYLGELVLDFVLSEIVLEFAQCCPDGFSELTTQKLGGEEGCVFGFILLEVASHVCEGLVLYVEFKKLDLHLPIPDVLEP